ncbi:MAG: glycosyltransferase family 39 protein, partial [Gammaproteobacteria bacterium]
MNPRNPHIADIFAGLLVLFLAAWFAPDVTPGEAAYPQDSHYYLKTAQNIYNGVGYSGHDRLAEGQIWTDPEVMRGPLYPLTMAAAFSVMGYGMDTALALGSVLFVANAVVLFLLGRVLFGWRVGLLASLYLMFSSLTLFAGSVVMLDSLLALLSLLTFLFYFLAARENRALYFVLAGLSFGLAYLTKELALLYLGLPFALGAFIAGGLAAGTMLFLSERSGLKA